MDRTLKMISWNVNGLRAVVKKDFYGIFSALDADIFALQETKLQAGQIEMDLPGYHQYWSYAEKKGYSGTAVFTRVEPLQVVHELGIPELDTEGRIVALEFDEFWFVCVYTPNAQNELKRIDHRMAWDDAFREFVCERVRDKGVIICGDMNVAHNEIDLKNPGPNRGNAGFSDEERGKFTELLEAGFIDTFRDANPDLADIYTWWSYRFRARQSNAGWRIDYFLASEGLREKIGAPAIYNEVLGSDHCPVGLSITVAV